MTTSRKALVWALAHPLDLKRSEPAIASALRSTLRANDAERHSIHVSESSGWISYVDRAQLWRRNPPERLPTNASEARAHAEHFLRELALALDEPSVRRRAGSLDGISLIPSLQHAETVVVASTESDGWDHWLYRAQPSVPLDTERGRAPLFGSQFEVRVGDGGRIVSYTARYRPVTDERLLSDVHAFAPDAVHLHGHGGAEPGKPASDEAPPPIVYVQEGDGIPQHYLSPYYLVDDGHVLALASASPWSLVVSLEIEPFQGRTRVTAVVDGGSGEYAFDWGIYEIEAMGEGHRALGSGAVARAKDRDGRALTVSSVTLSSGAYVMLLNVKDRRTGAFKHHQEQVYANVPAHGMAHSPGVKL